MFNHGQKVTVYFGVVASDLISRQLWLRKLSILYFFILFIYVTCSVVCTHSMRTGFLFRDMRILVYRLYYEMIIIIFLPITQHVSALYFSSEIHLDAKSANSTRMSYKITSVKEQSEIIYVTEIISPSKWWNERENKL